MEKSAFKKIIAVLLALATLMLAGCQNKEPVNEKPIQNGPNVTVEKLDVPHPLSVGYTYNGLAYIEGTEANWKSALKENGIEFVEEIYTSEDGRGHIITANESEYHEDMVDTYAVYADYDSIYVETVCEDAIIEKIEVCEINGDTTGEEIVLSFDFMGNGGAGSHTTEVWNFEYRTPNFLFSTSCDLGYASILNDNYEIIIDNIYTGYQTKVDCSKNELVDNFFDENGKPLDLRGASFDRAYETIVKDVDGDGDCELICKEYTHFSCHADYIGSTVTTIDYNKDMYGFVVVDAEFVEPENGELV